MRLSTVLVFFLILGVGSIGCGSGLPPKPKVFPVKGRVTLNGKPLTGCTLLLVTVKAAPGADDTYVGVLNDKGEFELASGGGKAGAAVGKYKVTFTGANPSIRTPEEMMKATMDRTARQPVKDPPYPKEYATFDTSKKEVEITADSNDLLIAL